MLNKKSWVSVYHRVLRTASVSIGSRIMHVLPTLHPTIRVVTAISGMTCPRRSHGGSRVVVGDDSRSRGRHWRSTAKSAAASRMVTARPRRPGHANPSHGIKYLEHG